MISARIGRVTTCFLVGLAVSVVGLGSVTAATAAPRDKEATPIASPDREGGTNVENVNELRFYDANGDSHVFEIEELPSDAGAGRQGTLQISPVATATYDHDTDYLLIHPKTGAMDFGGPGDKRFHDSLLTGMRGIVFHDKNDDGMSFRFDEITGGEFDGLFRFAAVKGEHFFLADPETGNVGFLNGVGIVGPLGIRGIPVSLGEPLEVNGQPLRGLRADPCDTCAVRADYFDADVDGVVDEAESVRTLTDSVGCESGQLCSTTVEVTVDAGSTKTVSFDHAFTSGIPQLIQNETFSPSNGSADRVPALTVETIRRNDQGAVTGVVVRNGDADAKHTGTVGIQGVVE